VGCKVKMPHQSDLENSADRGFLNWAARSVVIGSLFLLSGCNGKSEAPESQAPAPLPPQQLEQVVENLMPLQFENFDMRWEHGAEEGIGYLVFDSEAIYYTTANLLKKIGKNAEVVWQYRCSENEVIKDILVGKDRIFFLPKTPSTVWKEDKLRVISAIDGSFLWSPNDGYNIQPNFLMMHNNSIFTLGVMNHNDTIFAFSPTDGKEVYRMDFEKITGGSSPGFLSIYKNSVIAVTHHGSYSIDMETKKLNWEQWGVINVGYTPTEVFDNMLYYLVHTRTPTAILPGVVIGGEHDFELHAIDMDTGEKWKFDKRRDYAGGFKIPSPVFFTPEEQPIIVYMGSGKQYVFNAKTGKKTDMPNIPLDVVVYNGVAYALDENKILAYDPRTRNVIGKYEHPLLNGELIGIDDSGFYLRDGNTIRVFGNLRGENAIP